MMFKLLLRRTFSETSSVEFQSELVFQSDLVISTKCCEDFENQDTSNAESRDSLNSSYLAHNELVTDIANDVDDGPDNISIFDLRARETVRGTIKSTFKATIALCMIFPLMLCLFFGVGWAPKDNYHNVRIAVADLDGGIIGQAILTAASSKSLAITAEFVSSDISFDTIKNQINAGKYNAALVAMPGGSVALAAALRDTASMSYSAAAVAMFVFDEGRGGPAMASILRCVASLTRSHVRNRKIHAQSQSGSQTCLSLSIHLCDHTRACNRKRAPRLFWPSRAASAPNDDELSP
jgi:hypothetical protein